MFSTLRLSFIAIFLMLQACQYNSEEKNEKADQLHKKNDAASYNIQLGMGYLKQGDNERAKRKLLTALDLAPQSPDANGAMAYFLEKTGDIPKAKTYYLTALKLAPKGPQLNNYGTFLCRTGDYVNAEKYFLKAVQDGSYIGSAGAYENAGLCAESAKDPNKAKVYFTKALEQDPNRNQSLFELASIELKAGKSEQALQILQKYQQLSLNDPALVAITLKVAENTGHADVAAQYKLQLSKLNSINEATGENNEYTTNNG